MGRPRKMRRPEADAYTERLIDKDVLDDERNYEPYGKALKALKRAKIPYHQMPSGGVYVKPQDFERAAAVIARFEQQFTGF